VGTAPNRIFNIEWRAVEYDNNDNLANFEIRLYEGLNRFNIVYGQVDEAGTSATVGVQDLSGWVFTEYECNSDGLNPGKIADF